MHQSNLSIKSGILIFSFIFSALLFWLARSLNLGQTGEAIKLTEWYGFLSLMFLFLVMLAGPLYKVFPTFPFKGMYRLSLGGLGISAFYFAFLHTYVSFFGLLQGFSGLAFLQSSDLISIILAFIALFILALMAGTSFTWAMKALGKKWKLLHRFVYIAAIFIIIHVILVGDHFMSFLTPSAFISIAFLVILVILEGVAWQKYLAEKFPAISPRWFTAGVYAIALILFYIFFSIHLGLHPHIH